MKQVALCFQNHLEHPQQSTGAQLWACWLGLHTGDRQSATPGPVWLLLRCSSALSALCIRASPAYEESWSQQPEAVAPPGVSAATAWSWGQASARLPCPPAAAQRQRAEREKLGHGKASAERHQVRHQQASVQGGSVLPCGGAVPRAD